MYKWETGRLRQRGVGRKESQHNTFVTWGSLVHGCFSRLPRHIVAHAHVVLPMHAGPAASRNQGSEQAGPALSEFTTAG